MALEFFKAEQMDSLFRASPRGTCPVCYVPASRRLPLMELWSEDNEIVFEGCPLCLEEAVACSAEGRALVRVVLLVYRQQMAQEGHQVT